MLIIELEGGLVASVNTDDENLRRLIGDVVVIDLDVEGADEYEVIAIKAKNGTMIDAVVHLQEVTETVIDTNQLRDML